MALNEGACPSRLPRRTSPARKCSPPTVGTMSTNRIKMQCLEESLSEDQEMDEKPASSFSGSCDSPIETMEESRPDSYEKQLQQAEAEITSLNEQTRLLKENLQKLEEQIERLCKENEVLKSRRFVILLMARST